MSYPVLLLRVKAAMLDSIIIAVLIFSLAYLSIVIGISNPALKVLFIVIPVVLLEPAMIWITGGSVGHHYSGIRIVGKDSGTNLFILNGIVRFVVKTLLGLISLVAMLLTRRHQSLHDIVSRSVVVFKNEDAALPRHMLQSRETVYRSEKPSIGRRLVVVIAYLFLIFMAYSLLFNFLASPNCLNNGQCSEAESFNLGVATLVFLVLMILVFIFGMLCKLPGAYFRASKNSEQGS